MLNGLAPHFTTKYVRPYEIVARPHLNVYMLKLSISFVTHLIFRVLKLNFITRNHRLFNQEF
jgi:hypothetical protein